MRYFPAFMDLQGRRVLVIGADELAVRKIRLLKGAGPDIHVFSAPEGSLVRQEFGEAVIAHGAALAASDLMPRPALVVVATENEAEADAAIALVRAAGVPLNAVDRPADCDVVVPSIVERGDLVIGISTGGAAPVVGRRLRERLEAMLPTRLGDLLDFARDRRDAIADAVPHAARRGFWERLLSGPVAECVLSGDMVGAEAAFARALDTAVAPLGTIHIVGAGPGDPELLTLKALRVCQEADVVLYDNLVSDAVLSFVRRDAERRYVGKRRADHSMPQEDIGALMVSLAREGKRVVRLKGGDPFVFGRGGEELDAVRAAGLEAQVVPGITAAAGCGASASMPLTHRGLSQAVTFVTAQGGNGGAPDVDWGALARLGHTLVVYMGVARAGEVASALMAQGRAATTPAAIVENGTLPTQRIVRTSLGRMARDLAEAGITGPAVLFIGEVAARADGAGLVELAREGAMAA